MCFSIFLELTISIMLFPTLIWATLDNKIQDDPPNAYLFEILTMQCVGMCCISF